MRSAPLPSVLPAFLLPLLLAGAACTNDTTGNGGGTPDAGTANNGECTRNSDCLSGHCPDLPGEPRACRSQCRTDGTCETGLACTRIGGERLCLPLVDTRVVGNRCTSSRQCVSGTCALADNQDDGVCVEQCPANGACPQGQICAVDHRVSSRPFCMPPTASLANGDDCTNGRQCVGGRCTPWGGRLQCAPGCAACGEGATCIAHDEYGEACLGLLPLLDTCGGNRECASTTCYEAAQDAGPGVCVGPCGPDSLCPVGMACVTLLQSRERTCVPLEETRAAGSECTTAEQCASGRCARFAAPQFDGGTLCADPCMDGTCTAPQVCWGHALDAGSRGLCGPRPF